MMEALDGNAIGGVMYDVFGAEMTNATGVCAQCGAQRFMAECEVYLGGPGIVARCRSCHAVIMVLVEVRGVTCVDLSGLSGVAAPT
jgi:hypothetical protein